MSDNFVSQDFFNLWNECLISRLTSLFDSDSFSGTALQEAYNTLLDSPEWQDAMQALDEALVGAGTTITSLLTFELQFLCSYDGATGSAFPTSEYAQLEKAKIILNSLNYVLDTLEFKHKKLIHILIELIGLAQ